MKKIILVWPCYAGAYGHMGEPSMANNVYNNGANYFEWTNGYPQYDEI